MFWLYFLAIIPVCIGLTIKLTNKEVNWMEYAIGSGLALVTAGAFHCWAYYGQVGDQETWSGSIVQARQYSNWLEYFEYAVYRTEYYTENETSTDSKGRTSTRTVTKSRQVFDHWEPTSRWHHEHWNMESNIDTKYTIDKAKFLEVSEKFGGHVPIPGNRTTGEHNSRMIGGDPNDYVATNKTGYIEPVTKSVFFENRIKASNNIFSKRKVSPEEAKTLFPYPVSEDPFTSGRVLGEAQKQFSTLEWDQMNAKLGPSKKINLICIGYPAGTDQSKFDAQIAYWQGGKKNDFIIGYSDSWSRVYSWSESELAKINVTTLFLKPDAETLSKLESEIRTNYTKVEWKKKFQYLSINPQFHHVVWYLIVLVVTQIGIYIVFHFYDISPNNDFRASRFSRY